jgi:hypothetical protein
MHFGTKSYLKSNRNHTAKQTLRKPKSAVRWVKRGQETWMPPIRKLGDTYEKAATPHYLPLSESDVLFPHCYVSQ